VGEWQYGGISRAKANAISGEGIEGKHEISGESESYQWRRNSALKM
jgi:hypothetical protein